MIKNFYDFFYLKESLYGSTRNRLGSVRHHLKEEILNAIEDSMDSSDLIDLQNWIGKFEEGDPNTVIVNLTDDSDLYDFYLKHQDDIDAILGENNWFDNSMSDLNISSLYDNVTEGTKEGIKLTISEIKNELF